MSDTATSDAGYDEWVDAVAAGEGYSLACPEGHGSLPPRRVCPRCGATDLEREPLPESGTVETYTTCYVGVPDFEAEEPYVTAIADFDGVRLTGVVRGVDPEDVAIGLPVEPDVATNRTTGDPLLVLRAR
jgi:uncharacterized OB-fold protein